MRVVVNFQGITFLNSVSKMFAACNALELAALDAGSHLEFMELTQGCIRGTTRI